MNLQMSFLLLNWKVSERCVCSGCATTTDT